MRATDQLDLFHVPWFLFSVIGLGITGWFGFVVVRKLVPQLESSITVGAGILVGLSALGFIQTSVPLLRQNPRLALVLMGATTIATSTRLWRQHWNSPTPRSRAFRRPLAENGLDFQTVLVILGAAVFALNYFTAWTHVLGLSLVGLGLSLKRPSGQVVRFRIPIWLAFGTLVVVSEWIRRLEPGWWFAAGPDATFFESLGWSLATRGPHAHPGLPEGSTYGYHYLAYAVSGSLSYVSDAPPYVILNIVVPFAMLVSLSLVLLPELRRASNSLSGSAVVLLMYFALLRVSSTVSFHFSIWAMVVYFSLSKNSHPQEYRHCERFRREFLLTLVGLIALFGKATVLPAILSLGLWFGWVRLRRVRHRTWIDIGSSTPTHLIVLICVFFSYYPRTSPLHTGPSLIRALSEYRINDGLWSARESLLLVSTLVAIGVLAWLSQARAQVNATEGLLLLAWTSVAGIATLLIAPDPPVQTYLMDQMTHLTYLTLLTPVSLFVAAIRKKQGILAAIVVSSYVVVMTVFSLLYEYLFSERNSQALSGVRAQRWMMWLLTIIPRLSIVVFTVSCAVLIVARKDKIARVSRLGYLSASSAVLLLTSVSVIAVDTVQDYSGFLRDTSRTTSFQSPHPDDATFEVGRFIRESTPNNAVIASNSFCCRGINWLTEEAKRLTEFESLTTHPQFGGDSWGGHNYQLPSVSRRQFLLAGPLYLVTRDTAQVIARRLEASVLFAATGSNEHRVELSDDGANYFVVDKAALGDLPMPDYRENALFENSRYLVLNLNS